MKSIPNSAYVYMWYPEAWGNEQDVASVRRNEISIPSGMVAIASEPKRQCEENERLVRNGFEPIYKRNDCDRYTDPGDVPPPPGGKSIAIASYDPNDIYGYQDAEGDKTIRNGLVDVWFTIEFENDPEFATASAHDIYVSDQLSPELFDLSSFAPTRIQIGNKEAELTGQLNGVVTVNMQPEIYAIAQVEWTLDEQTGMANWHISSLDPMTMEPTTDVLQGVLPVNSDGNGIGQLSFDIRLKPNLPNGTQVPNKAVITFDENEPIETPTWTNVIENIKMGDLTGDGQVTSADVWVLMGIIARGETAAEEPRADVNGDGRIDIGDVTSVIAIMTR